MYVPGGVKLPPQQRSTKYKTEVTVTKKRQAPQGNCCDRCGYPEEKWSYVKSKYNPAVLLCNSCKGIKFPQEI